MSDYSVSLASYTIGADAYDKLAAHCLTCGKKALAVGGKTALEKALPKIQAALAGTGVELADPLWYGGECTYENIDLVVAAAGQCGADMILGVGGGKALDTAKGAAQRAGVPVFCLPTIAATCAATSAQSIVYTADSVFDSFYFLDGPAAHVFIDTQIIAEAPVKYLRAGIGDTVAKHYECALSAQNDELAHSDALAVQVSGLCVGPIRRYGLQALADCRQDIATFALEQVVLAIIVTTGMVSVLIQDKYNGALAHSLFYGFTILPHFEEHYLHGDVVGYGVLVQLAVEKRQQELAELYQLFADMGLPTCLADIGVRCDREELAPILAETLAGADMEYLPWPITGEMVLAGIEQVEALAAPAKV